jgi:hypothetical protein
MCGGNDLNQFRRFMFADIAGDIGLGQDADASAIIVYDEDAPDLVPFHYLKTLLQAGVLADGDRAPGHNITGRHAQRILVLSHRPNSYVTVGYRADRPFVLVIDYNRDAAAVVIGHHLCNVRQAGLSETASGVLGHYFVYLHLFVSLILSKCLWN